MSVDDSKEMGRRSFLQRAGRALGFVAVASQLPVQVAHAETPAQPDVPVQPETQAAVMLPTETEKLSPELQPMANFLRELLNVDADPKLAKILNNPQTLNRLYQQGNIEISHLSDRGQIPPSGQIFDTTVYTLNMIRKPDPKKFDLKLYVAVDASKNTSQQAVVDLNVDQNENFGLADELVRLPESDLPTLGTKFFKHFPSDQPRMTSEIGYVNVLPTQSAPGADLRGSYQVGVDGHLHAAFAFSPRPFPPHSPANVE